MKKLLTISIITLFSLTISGCAFRPKKADKTAKNIQPTIKQQLCEKNGRVWDSENKNCVAALDPEE